MLPIWKYHFGSLFWYFAQRIANANLYCKFYIKNVKGVGLYDGQTNFRISDETVSGSFKTGTFNTSNPEFNTTVKKTLSDPEDVGCLFVYSFMPKGASIEFDVEFYVNGERWI